MSVWDEVLTEDDVSEGSTFVGPQQPAISQSASSAWDAVFEEEADRTARVGKVLGSVFPDGSMPQDKETAAYRLAQETGANVRFIRPRIDRILSKWNESKFDAESFTRDHPGLTDLLVRKPELAPLVAQDYGLTTKGGDLFWKNLAGWASFGEGSATGFDIFTGLLAPPGTPGFLDTLAGTDVSQIAGDAADAARESVSPQGQQRIADTQITGDIADPSSISLGRDPSAMGLALQMSEIAGQLGGTLLAGLFTGGIGAGITGGLSAAGGAAEQAEETIREASRITTPGQPSRLEQESPLFRQLLEDGVPYDQAVDTVARETAQFAAWAVAPVGAIGGAATQRIASPATRILATRGIATQAGARILGGGLEEALQEVTEGIATQAGIRTSGLDESLTEGSFANAFLGALGGGAAGSVGAVGVAAQARTERRIRQAEAILEAAAASKLMEASPKSFAEAVAAETKRTGEPVEALHFDAEPVLTLMQEARLDPVALLGEDGAARLSQAISMGGTFAVPVEALEALAKSPIGEKLRSFVTITPSDLTRAARDAENASIEVDARKLAETIDQQAPGENESRFLAAIEESARAALGKKDRKPNLALWRAFVHTMADREGRAPDELFAEILVRVRRQQGQGVESAFGGVVPAAAAAAPAPAVSPAPASPAPTSTTRIITPQRPQGEPARYRVIEAADLIASHDENGFQPNPLYPEGVQEREYHRQAEEQVKVAGGAQSLNPAILLSDDPGATNGPPIVTGGERAIVMGGNGRSMMIRRGFQDEATRETYRAALLERAGRFGLDTEQIRTMQAPVLVRVLDEVTDTADAADMIAAVRRTNESMTQALSPRAMAVAEARSMSPQTITDIATLLEGDSTLREVMRDRPKALVDILRRDGLITPQNQSAWLEGGTLTDAAKDRIEGMFLGRVVGSGDRMAQTAPAVLAKLERIAPHLLRVEGTNPDFSETATVQAALDLLNDARNRGLSVEQAVAQVGLFDQAQHDPNVVRMAGLLTESKPTHMAARFRAWADVASFNPRQAQMFAPNPTRQQTRETLLGETTVGRLEQGPVILHQPAISISLTRDRMDPAHWHPLGATYHLDAMKRASARGDEKRAQHHLKLYERHVEEMGHDPAGPTPDSIPQDDRPIGHIDDLDAMANRSARPRGRPAVNADPAAEVPRYHEADRLLGVKESLLQRAEAFVGRRADGPVMRDGAIVFQDSPTTPRGFMERKGNEIAITLTPNADRSTFLHETGHAFLEIFLDLAQREDASESVKNDAAAILAHFGIDSREAITTEHHEQWAREFEAYLMEGKAPSVELRNAFAQFKKWLTAIYRTIRNLNVELDDEIRGIFDRLLAVEDEMQAAAANVGVGRKLFNSHEEAGVSPEEFNELLAKQEKMLSHAQRRVELKALRELERQATKAWRDEQAKLRDEAEFEYESMPERIAWLYLRGKQALDDGTIVETGESPRLDYAAVVEAVGVDSARRFLTASDGSHPDEIAAMLGFPSGAVMLQRVNALPGKRQWAQDRAAALMAERHRGLMESRVRLRQEIEKGLHGDLTAEYLAEEDRLLHRKAGIDGKPPPLAVIKRAAEIAAEQRQVKNLKPHHEQRAERRLAEEAYRAARDTDYGKAGVKKRQQRIRHAMFRAVTAVREEVDKAEDALTDAAKKQHRAELNKASPDLLGASDALLAAVGIAAESEAAPEERIAAFDAAVAFADAKANPIPAEDANFLRALLAQPVRWRDLSVLQARAVRDTVLQFGAIAKRANEIRMGEEMLAKEDAIERIVTEGSTLPDQGKAFIARQQKGRKRRFIERIVGLRGDVIDPEHMFDRLGPTISRLVIDRYRESRDKKVALSKEVLEPLLQKWKEMPAEVRERRFEQVPDFPFKFPENAERAVDRITLLMMALNVGNASNLERLAGGFGWDEKAIRDYLGRTLTKAEWDFVQSMWDLMDTGLWPEVAAKEARVKGLPPEKIKAVAVQTPHGTYRGGYFPARYDERGGMVQAPGEADESSVAGYFDKGYRRAATRKSHTKERAAHYSEIVRLDWQVVPSHIAQVIHDVSFDEMVRDIAPIFEDDRVREVFRRRLGERRANDPKEFLKFVANQQAVSAASIGSDTARYAMLARSIMVTKAIGWSLRVAMSGFADPFVAAARGRKYGGTSSREFGKAYVDAMQPKWQRWVAERSAEVRGRMQADVEAERIKQISDFGKKKLPGAAAVDAVARTSFFFTNHVDRILATQIWLASYRADLKRGVAIEEAQRRADKAVSKNLAGNDRAMMGRLQRQPGFVGSIFVFYSYFGKLANVFNTLGEAAGDAARRRDYTAMAEIAGRTLAVMVAAGPLAEFFGGMGPEDDEEIFDYVQREAFTLPLRTVPLVGHTAAGLTQQAVWGRGNAFSSRDPGAGMVWAIGQGLIKATDGDATAAEKALAAAGILLAPVRVPMSQPKRTFNYLNRAYLTGEEPKPSDPFEFLSGAAFGPRSGRGTDPFAEISDLIQGR